MERERFVTVFCCLPFKEATESRQPEISYPACYLPNSPKLFAHILLFVEIIKRSELLYFF